MTAIVLLFALGVVLLGFEVIVPGAILGIVGGLALIGGVVLAFFEFGAGGGWWSLAIAVALVVTTLTVEFVILPRTRFGKQAFLTAAVDGTSQPAIAVSAEIVGRVAEAVTPLSPSGVVVVEGKRYEAFSRSGHVGPGAQLRVVGVDNFRLIVTQNQNT